MQVQFLLDFSAKKKDPLQLSFRAIRQSQAMTTVLLEQTWPADVHPAVKAARAAAFASS